MLSLVRRDLNGGEKGKLVLFTNSAKPLLEHAGSPQSATLSDDTEGLAYVVFLWSGEQTALRTAHHGQQTCAAPH